MNTIYVVPREGYSIVDPDRRDHLPVVGRLVQASTYWYARERDGDIVVTDTPLVTPALSVNVAE